MSHHSIISQLPKVRSDAIMGAPNTIEGIGCTARIAGFIGLRCSPPETCIMAHMPGVGGKGMSTKVCDVSTYCACATCHRLLDEPSPAEADAIARYGAAVFQQLIRAADETRRFLIRESILIVPDGRLI